MHLFISCFSSGSRTSLGKPVVWARGNSLKVKEMETPSWEMWETDSKLSPQVKYYVLQMGVTVFEEADLVFCCSTSQKMKRKTSLPTLQDTGVAFSSFPDHVSDIHTLMTPQMSPPSLYKRGRRPRKYQVYDSPTSS